MTKPPTRDQAIAELAEFFQRNGCVRWPNQKRVLREGYTLYKKGAEVRLKANTKAERGRILRLLRLLGFRPGNPYEKGSGFAIPLYGHGPVAEFLELIGEPTTDERESDA